MQYIILVKLKAKLKSLSIAILWLGYALQSSQYLCLSWESHIYDVHHRVWKENYKKIIKIDRLQSIFTFWGRMKSSNTHGSMSSKHQKSVKGSPSWDFCEKSLKCSEITPLPPNVPILHATPLLIFFVFWLTRFGCDVKLASENFLNKVGKVSCLSQNKITIFKDGGK